MAITPITPEQSARNLLSMFTESQQRDIGNFFLSRGSGAFAALRTDAENPYSMPAVFALVDRRLMPSDDHMRWMQIALSAMMIDAIKTPLTDVRVKAILNRFGIGSAMAERIANQVNLPDELTGWANRFEYAAKWFANIFLPKAWEFSEKAEDIDPNLDLNSAYEWVLFGKALEELLIMAKLQSVSALSALGPQMLDIAAAGDPVAQTDLEQELYGSMIAMIPWYLNDAETGGLFSGLKKLGRSIGKVVSKVAGPALALIPGGGVLRAAASPLLNLFTKKSTKDVPTSASNATPTSSAQPTADSINKLETVAEIFDKADVAM